EYLGTVDCSRWPEATDALVKALLDDHNECVRFAAAKALTSGCCCNKETIKALRDCISGDNKKYAPETSPRVKAAAFAALQNCLMRVPEDLPVETPGPERSQPPGVPAPPKPERSTMNAADGTHIATAYTEAGHAPLSSRDRKPQQTFAQTVEEARRTLFEVSRNPRPPAFLPTGKRSVFDVLAKARQDAKTATLQHAREQGHVPPVPNTVDPGVAPASYNPAAAPFQANPIPTPASEPIPMSSTELPGQQTGNDPSAIATNNNARRGLVGMLFQSRNRQTDQ
ncbi:MAG TPA: HEAT repeat domain-containing protein, partial [Isosphaeraceae bacterium]|nr:HEAT repeat domain-containing protein [Isosphaeraceae bacterium]